MKTSSIDQLTIKFTRLLKDYGYYDKFVKKLFASTNNCLVSSLHKINSKNHIIFPYVRKQIDEIEQIISRDPYGKLFLNDYGVNCSIKYHEILNDEKMLLFVLFLRAFGGERTNNKKIYTSLYGVHTN